mmetsp:Transcript_15784/g.38332  ORF Transcript_15784/g.38332 Transcript_15784/m.38332 type:complete len:337 (+) Transcript_15784:12692-13702(+)
MVLGNVKQRRAGVAGDAVVPVSEFRVERPVLELLPARRHVLVLRRPALVVAPVVRDLLLLRVGREDGADEVQLVARGDLHVLHVLEVLLAGRRGLAVGQPVAAQKVPAARMPFPGDNRGVSELGRQLGGNLHRIDEALPLEVDVVRRGAGGRRGHRGREGRAGPGVGEAHPEPLSHGVHVDAHGVGRRLHGLHDLPDGVFVHVDCARHVRHEPLRHSVERAGLLQSAAKRRGRLRRVAHQGAAAATHLLCRLGRVQPQVAHHAPHHEGGSHAPVVPHGVESLGLREDHRADVRLAAGDVQGHAVALAREVPEAHGVVALVAASDLVERHGLLPAGG